MYPACSLHFNVLFVKHFVLLGYFRSNIFDKYHQHVEGCIEITTTLDSPDSFKISNHQTRLCPPFHSVGEGGQGGQFIHGHGQDANPLLLGKRSIAA